ncbi:MAG: hypothetical protein PSV16_14705 [Flavobacterium sp.]|nr:hypothetical protein [Flavobacterium sp.]
MKIIHSLWSLPLLRERWGISEQFTRSYNLFKLSFLYAKRLGYEVVLHTDDTGYELLKDVGYDRIELSLNDFKEADKDFWAMSKIRALELEDLGSIHIDGDVFLKSSRIKEIFEQDYDVLTQMPEALENYNRNYRHQVELVNSVSKLIQSPVRHSYNCGVIGFKDAELFSEYVKLSKALVDLYKNTFKLKDYYRYEYRHYERMLIAEQYSLPVLTERLNKNAKFIINQDDDIDQVCEEYGFVHAIGQYKYSDEFQSLVLQRTKQLQDDI